MADVDRPDMVTLGETMAAFRTAGPLRLGGQVNLSIAGAESNVAIGLARLGARTRWVGGVGADELGELVLRVLRAEGVDTTAARTVREAPTGLIIFEERTSGTVRVTYHRDRSAGATLCESDAEAALADQPRVLHITGITSALGPDPRRAVFRAVDIARAQGTLVSLDVNYRATLWSRQDAREVLVPLAASSDILVGSDDELDLVAPERCKGLSSRIAALLDQGVQEVVVKRGRHGAEVHTAGDTFSLPAVPVREVDAVGAGDAFVAGYLSALLDHQGVTQRLERGNTLGAFAVATRGDWEGLPYRAELSLLQTGAGFVAR